MNEKTSFRDQIWLVYQVGYMLIFAVKLDILTWGLLGTDLLWSQPQAAIQGTAVSDPSKLASFFRLLVGVNMMPLAS